MNRRRFLRQVSGLSVGLLFPGALVRYSENNRSELGGGLFLPAARAEAASNRIYLTIDDGYIGLAEKIAAVNALGIRATFFLVGQVIEEHPADVQELVNSGHVLGNHTYDHRDLTLLGRAGVRSEIDGCEAAAVNTVGVSTQPLMRPPSGNINSTVRAVAADMGYSSILWNWDTRDWAGSSVSYIEQNFGEGIVLMHSQGTNTVRALSDIVPALLAQGYVFDVL